MSAFYNKPWAPGYSLPAYLSKEDPLTRGSAVVTKMLPRGTISNVKGLDKRTAGYSLPAYVRNEPVGSQAGTTPWTPRGTVMSMSSIKTGLPWKSSAHTLDSNGLGALGATAVGTATIGGNDPIAEYGKKAAVVVAQTISSVPVGQRENNMRKLLDEVDKGLYTNYIKQRKKFENMGQPAPAARQNALAAAFSGGITKEFMKLGKGRKRPEPGTGMGAVSLGALMGFEAQASNYQDLGGILSRLSNGLKKLGGLACDVSTNPIAPLAAGAAGAYYGGAQGASTAIAGVGVAAAACSASDGPGPMYPAPAQGMPGWALPAILGGGALALILILKK
jgi:hypothetical protein